MPRVALGLALSRRSPLETAALGRRGPGVTEAVGVPRHSRVGREVQLPARPAWGTFHLLLRSPPSGAPHSSLQLMLAGLGPALRICMSPQLRIPLDHLTGNWPLAWGPPGGSVSLHLHPRPVPHLAHRWPRGSELTCSTVSHAGPWVGA